MIQSPAEAKQQKVLYVLIRDYLKRLPKKRATVSKIHDHVKPRWEGFDHHKFKFLLWDLVRQGAFVDAHRNDPRRDPDTEFVNGCYGFLNNPAAFGWVLQLP